MSAMPFIHDDFLLGTRSARRLYHEFAEAEPIFDYHCHLSPRDIAENRRFNNLHEIWLEGDHYKWRAMRSNGVPERLCTGDATPQEKFSAWAETVPRTLRNPLYHWTHLELSRYFGISELLNSQSADRIWAEANERLASPEYSTRGILERFRVTALCTTDDPADDLRWHEVIRESGGFTEVRPAFRPDAALAVHRPESWRAWLKRLEAASGKSIASLPTMLDTLRARRDYFHERGCRLSDHGLERCSADACSDREADAIFQAALSGTPASPTEHAKFISYVMLFLGRLYAEKGWTMQLHLGALRNNNTRLMRCLGPDTGFDSIGDFPQAQALGAFLDRLDADDLLPKTILYNLNPADNYAFATMLGNFPGENIRGKVQLGSGWWFLDQKEAMEWQINALSNLGLLANFVGMVTDSRSFMSFPRHEYFRRVLCNLVGRDMEAGELPPDFELVGSMIRNICHENAQRYFCLP